MPAITHVDSSARLQSVSRATNPLYHEFITRIAALSVGNYVVSKP